MSGLTCGERIVRCLCGEQVDRVPFGVGIGWGPWGQTLQRWRRELGDPDLDVREALGYDASFIQPEINCGFNPLFKKVVLEEDDRLITYRDERGVTTRGRKDGGSTPQFLAHPVKTAADWELLREERPRIDDPMRVSQDWDAFRGRIQQTGEAVLVGQHPYGPFGTCWVQRKYSSASIPGRSLFEI